MIALQIEDMGDFTKKLLIGTMFDRFLVSSLTIATGTTLTLDGHLNAAYFDNIDTEAREEDAKPRAYALWSECKSLAFERIKGKRLPLSFRFVLMADDDMINALCAQSAALAPEQIDGLFLNIAYNGASISCTTGAALHTFSLDKTAEHLWDEAVRRFFQKQQIAFI